MDEARSYWERPASRYGGFMLLLGGPMPEATQAVAEEVQGLGRVLELAAGTGLVTQAIAPAVGGLVATDYAEAMVAQVRSRMAGVENVEVRQLDLYALDLEEQFDGIVAANVVHLLPDLPGALDRLVQALNPGGRLVVPTFCHDQNALARTVSWVSSLTAFPSDRRFNLESLVAAGDHEDLVLRQHRLVRGLLPIGFVSAEKKYD